MNHLSKYETATRPHWLSLAYDAQRAYVGAMLRVLERLVVAGSAADPVLQREIAGFPEGYTIELSVAGEREKLCVVARGTHFTRRDERDTRGADLAIVFKHIAHAFRLLAFLESTPLAYAHGRMVTHGDVALTMRFVRCLDRVQALVLPSPIAARALKSLPEIKATERLAAVVRIARALIRPESARRSTP